MDKDKKYIYIMTAVFLLGLTLGSTAGVGAEPGISLSADVTFDKYLTAAVAANLPFWCAIFLPRTFRHRLMCGGGALLFKGGLLGCASAFILSAPGRSWYFYAINILPQTFFTVPLYIFAIAAGLGRGDGSYTYSSVLASLIASLLVTFVSSCVQYLIFLCFYTIQGVFITKI